MQVRPVGMAMRYRLVGVLVGVTMTLRLARVPVRVVSVIMAMGVCMYERGMDVKMLVSFLEQHVE